MSNELEINVLVNPQLKEHEKEIKKMAIKGFKSFDEKFDSKSLITEETKLEEIPKKGIVNYACIFNPVKAIGEAVFILAIINKQYALVEFESEKFSTQFYRLEDITFK